MAEFFKASEETEQLVSRIADETGISRVRTVVTATTPKSKKLIEIKTCPPFGEYVAEKRGVIGVIIYEQAFERLTPIQQEMLMCDAFNMIQYDFDKDKVTIGCPQIVISQDGRAKWGKELINAAETSLIIMQQIEEERKEQKEREKALKKAKKKF